MRSHFPRNWTWQRRILLSSTENNRTIFCKLLLHFNSTVNYDRTEGEWKMIACDSDRHNNGSSFSPYSSKDHSAPIFIMQQVSTACPMEQRYGADSSSDIHFHPHRRHERSENESAEPFIWLLTRRLFFNQHLQTVLSQTFSELRLNDRSSFLIGLVSTCTALHAFAWSQHVPFAFLSSELHYGNQNVIWFTKRRCAIVEFISPFYSHLALHDTRNRPAGFNELESSCQLTNLSALHASNRNFLFELRRRYFFVAIYSKQEQKQFRLNSSYKDINILRLMSHVNDCKQFNVGGFRWKTTANRHVRDFCDAFVISFAWNFLARNMRNSRILKRRRQSPSLITTISFRVMVRGQWNDSGWRFWRLLSKGSFVFRGRTFGDERPDSLIFMRDCPF